MKKRNVVAICLLISISAKGIQLPEAEVTVRVADEQSQPVANATVGVGFSIVKADGSGEQGTMARSGQSDASGTLTVLGRSLPFITYGAKKDGYYPTTGLEYSFTPILLSNRTDQTLPERYDPWNPLLNVVLKKIIHPIPMYARKRCTINIPSADRPIGFDLIACDWVAPLGKGKVGDLNFTLYRLFNSRTDFNSSLRIQFASEGDGIQSVLASGQHGSALRLPHLAPEDGYKGEWFRENSARAPMKVESNQNYFYRVRTVKEDGKIKSAMYGKIYGEIQFDVINAPTAAIIFTYYLNPDGTRNTEFDPKNNLFRDLPPIQRVTDP